MHPSIEAYQAILNNRESKPEAKERAVTALRAIPGKDPRYGDAQLVLSQLGLIPVIDWPKLEELYTASASPDDRIREGAIAAIENSFDEWLMVYNNWPDEKDRVLAASRTEKAITKLKETIGWLARNPGESDSDFFAREERIRSNKLALLLIDWKHKRAREIRQTDFDYVIILGHRFHLALWPPHGGVNLPDPTPNEVILPAN